jgi:hypothetical protein
MVAIAGAILIHATCIRMATTKESPDIYPRRLFLIVVGAAMIGADLGSRVLEFSKNVREAARNRPPTEETRATPDRGGK